MSVYTFQLPDFNGSRSEDVFNDHSSYHGSKHIQGTLRESVMYEGRSICNENSPVYPKVLHLHIS